MEGGGRMKIRNVVIVTILIYTIITFLISGTIAEAIACTIIAIMSISIGILLGLFGTHIGLW